MNRLPRPYACALALVVIGSLVHSNVGETISVPNQFEAGTPARASEVNENFEVLSEAVNRACETIGSLSDQVDLNTSDIAASSESESDSSPQGILTVALEGGDFDSVAAAIAFGLETLEGPFVVRVAPGVFEIDELVTVPEGVTLEGSGRGRTILRGDLTANQSTAAAAVVSLEESARLKSLTVENTGASAIAIGVSVAGTDSSTEIVDVEVLVEGEGGTGHIGIQLQDSDARVTDTKVAVSGATTLNLGVGSTDSGGPFAQPLFRNLTVDADGVNSGVGVQMSRTAAKFFDCQIDGMQNSIVANVAGISRVHNSEISTLGLNPVYSQTGSAAILSASTAFVGGTPEGLPTQFKYAHCVKPNFDVVVNGFGSSL